ncbi:hypothetical protein Rfer_3048 [Rhodoferax ferrireducens T118]|uniref:Uncharacterized protein n=1 Tax=Albidiferax ferrireducens (strain ATCC BAA-621 / DSM 15236 / T118) TaxID=338969 RepID=Q21TZ5_ALBFT|nr:hypothetical protein [Rhodoferax ferrireducens]ABD70758.1 hypothetical protein Rfer_3048 [Rhodoferax ferrireducens T118]
MPTKRQSPRHQPAGIAQHEPPAEPQTMRYLSRFQHPDAALPIERSVAKVVSRLLRFTPELLNGDLAALVQEEVHSRQGLTGNPRPMGFTQ